MKLIYNINNLTFKYDNEIILKNINLKIYENEFLGILGVNGSGKSTLVKCLLNILNSYSGEILFNGNDIKKIKKKDLAKKIAYVPQNVYINFDYSIKELLLMGRYPQKNLFSNYTEEDYKLLNEIIDYLDIKDLKDRNLTELSGGEIQRAMIGRALMQEPEVLILDEPLSHLDIRHQLDIFKLLENLNKNKNITIIMVSHDLNLSIRFFKRIIVLKNGQIAEDGIPEVIFNPENLKKLFNINADLISIKGVSSKCLIIKD